MDTLLTQAKTSFAEISAIFGITSGNEFAIDQEPGAEYQVKVRFAANPAKPVLMIERMPKRNLASVLIEEDRDYPRSLRRLFEASLEKPKLSWLERSSGRYLSQTDIVGTVRSLLQSTRGDA